jgi:hypothetical protein
MKRGPFYVQVLNRGGWAHDTVTRSRSRAVARLLWLTRSPRRPAVARVVDVDGQAVTP